LGDGIEAGSGRFIQLRCSEWHLQDMRMNLKPFLLNEDMQRAFFQRMASGMLSSGTRN
jgi:hypothetical protein